MSKTGNPLLFSLLAAASLVVGGNAWAADQSFAGGGVLQDGFEALQQQFARQDGNAAPTKLSVVDGDDPVIGFTPRFGGVPIGLAEGVSVDRGSGPEEQAEWYFRGSPGQQTGYAIRPVP